MRINNINKYFLNVISGVPRGSVVGRILLNCFFNDFYVIETPNAYNFADDNTLTAFANNIQNLIHLLESESRLAVVKWFKDNKMIVNPGKFQVIILSKKKNNHT